MIFPMPASASKLISNTRCAIRTRQTHASRFETPEFEIVIMVMDGETRTHTHLLLLGAWRGGDELEVEVRGVVIHGAGVPL